MPTAVAQRAQLIAQGEDPSVFDQRIYNTSGGDYLLGVAGGLGGHGAISAAERVLGRGGEVRGGTPEAVPGADAPATAPTGPVPAGTSRQLGEATVVMQPNGRWGFAPGSPQPAFAVQAVEGWNAELDALSAPAAPAAPPTPVVRSTQEAPVTRPAGTTFEQSQASQQIDQVVPTLVAAHPLAAQMDALSARLAPLVEHARNLGRPGVDNAVNEIRNISLGQDTAVRQAVLGTVAEALDQTAVNFDPAVVQNPLAYSVLNLGLFSNAESSPASWAQAVRESRPSVEILQAIANDPMAGEARREAAQAVLQLYREARVALPTNVYNSNARPGLYGSYLPSQHQVTLNNNTSAASVPHEFLHGLLVGGLGRLMNSPQGQQAIAVLREIRDALRVQAGPGNPNYYAQNADYSGRADQTRAELEELLADIFSPDYLALATQVRAADVLSPAALSQAENLLQIHRNSSLFDIIVAAINRIIRIISPRTAPQVEGSIAELLAAIAATAARANRAPRATAEGRAAVDAASQGQVRQPALDPEQGALALPETEQTAPTVAQPVQTPLVQEQVETPAPEQGTLALPEVEQPAPEAEQPAPVAEQPAPEAQQPADQQPAPTVPATNPANRPTTQKTRRALTGLRALGRRVLGLLPVDENLEFRGVKAKGALNRTTETSAPIRTRLQHFQEAMQEGIDQLNKMDHDLGLNRQWEIVWLRPGRFDINVTTDGVKVSEAASGAWSNRAKRMAVQTLGFVNVPGRRSEASAGGRFYDIFYGASVASGVKPLLGALSPPNERRMPVNRLRAMLKWGTALRNTGRARGILSPESRYYRGSWGFQRGDSADTALLRHLQNLVFNKLGHVTFDGATFKVNGVDVTRAQLGTLANAAGISADEAALVGLANALGEPDASAAQLGRAFLDTQMSQGQMLFSQEPGAEVDGEMFSREAPATEAEREVHAARTAELMAEGLTGEPVSDPEFTSPRETFAEAIGRIAAGQQSAPATIGRGLMSAIRRGDRRALTEYMLAGGNELNDALHDAVGVADRWLASTPVSGRLQDQARHAMRTAPGRRDAMLAAANREHGGFELQELIRAFSAKYKLSAETIIDWFGKWTSARYAEQRNAWLIDKLARAAEKTSRARDVAEEAYTLAMETRSRVRQLEAARDLRAARAEARKAARSLRATIKAVFDPDPTISKPTGPVAGFTNAQAAHLMQLIEARIGKADLEKVADKLYDLNAWALTLDIESGRVQPAAAVAYTNAPENLELYKALHAAAQAYSTSILTDSEQATATLRELRAQVAAKVRSQYVPLTGNPELSQEHDPFAGGVRQPNTTNERSLMGRQTMPDDAITATLGRLMKSASYAGWAPFQDAIADIFHAMTEDERKQVGIRRDVLSPKSVASGNGLFRRRGNVVEKFEFRDKKILEALQEYNRGADALYSRILGAPSRWYAYMATQANLTFGVVNLARDAWERSEIIRGKTILDADGNPVNVDKVARRLLAYSFMPHKNFELFGATMRFAFRRPPKENSYADRMLQELSDMGGISVRGDTFSSSRTRLVKDASKSKLFTGIRDFIDGYNRMFDLLPLLASHMALREANVSADVAAANALDLFNFRKRGRLTKFVAPWFAFSQTSFTGGANAIGTLFNPNSKAPKFGNTHFLRKGVARLIGTTIVFMAIQSLARALAGDDEGGNKLANVNRFIQDTNLLVPVPGTDKYTRLPLSFGPARIAHGMARNLLAIGHDEATVGEALGSFMTNNLNPVVSPLEGTSIDVRKRPMQALMMVAAPSWAKPLAALAQNRDSNDVPIVFDSYEKTDEYRSEQFGRNTAPPYKEVAQFLRKTFHIDLAPEEVAFLVRSFPTGSIGHARQMFIDNPFAEERGRPTTNPILNRFISSYGDSGKLSQFYNGLEASNEVSRRMNVGETPSVEDMQLLAWRSWWDEQDNALRRDSRAIRANKLLSAAERSRLELMLQNRRREQQILAVYRLRQAQGKPTEMIDVPGVL